MVLVLWVAAELAFKHNSLLSAIAWVVAHKANIRSPTVAVDFLIGMYPFLLGYTSIGSIKGIKFSPHWGNVPRKFNMTSPHVEMARKTRFGFFTSSDSL